MKDGKVEGSPAGFNCVTPCLRFVSERGAGGEGGSDAHWAVRKDAIQLGETLQFIIPRHRGEVKVKANMWLITHSSSVS